MSRAPVWARNALGIAVVVALLTLHVVVRDVLPIPDRGARPASSSSQAELFRVAPDVLRLFVVIVLGTYVSIAVHEASHALTARYVGAKVIAVRIGAGRHLFAVRVRGARLCVHLAPSGGHTTMDLPESRDQQRLIVVAGPRADALLGVAYLLAAPSAGGAVRSTLVTLAVLQFVRFAANGRVTAPGPRRPASDGWDLARLEAGEDLRQARATTKEQWAEALRRSTAGECDEMLAVVDRATATLSPAKAAVWRPLMRSGVLSAAGRLPEALVAVDELAQADKDGEFTDVIALSRVDLGRSLVCWSGETPAAVELEGYARMLSELPNELSTRAEVEHTRALLLLAEGRSWGRRRHGARCPRGHR